MASPSLGAFFGTGEETVKPPAPADPPPGLDCHTQAAPLAPSLPLPAPGVVPVTGERSQLVVGKGILQVAVVGVVEHGLDSLPGARYKKLSQGATKRNEAGKRTRNRAESGESPPEPSGGIRAGQGGESWDQGKGKGPGLRFPFPN